MADVVIADVVITDVVITDILITDVVKSRLQLRDLVLQRRDLGPTRLEGAGAGPLRGGWGQVRKGAQDSWTSGFIPQKPGEEWCAGGTQPTIAAKEAGARPLRGEGRGGQRGEREKKGEVRGEQRGESVCADCISDDD